MKIKEIKNLENLKKFIIEDLKWDFNQRLFQSEDEVPNMFTEEQCQKLALIAFYCKVGENLESFILGSEIDDWFTYYIHYMSLYFRMYADQGFHNPSFPIVIDLDDNFDIIKHILDAHSLKEISVILRNSLSEIDKYL